MLLRENMELIKAQYNPNFIIGEQGSMQEAIDKGLLAKIAESKNGNVYFEISNGYNDVLMNIKDNKHIRINKTIDCYDQTINLIEVLVNYTFCIKKTGANLERERVVWNVDKKHEYLGVTQIPIERIIKSYERYGCLVNLGSCNDVHHKGKVYDCSVNNLEYLSKEEHAGKDSGGHRENWHIDSVESIRKLVAN